MSDRAYNVIDGPSPTKAWTKGVELDDRALQQLKNVASMPFVYKWVAAMPDAHWGMGATVGSVIATKGAIIPAALGVDLGCGMVAVETNLTAEDLPDNLAGIRSAIQAVASQITHKSVVTDLAGKVVNCHHNYIAKEFHYGSNVWVTRKGAVRAREGDMGIIPGSMGAKSYITRGKGNPESFHSSSHGAGRVMSRGEAKRKISLDDHLKATAGIECRKDANVIDESPAAYKSIEAVMEAQHDLVEVVHTLKQVICVKG